GQKSKPGRLCVRRDGARRRRIAPSPTPPRQRSSWYRDRPSTTRFCRAAGLRRRVGAGASTWAREPSNWLAADDFVVPQLGIVRGARAAAAAIVDHDAVGLGTRHDLAQAAGIEYDQPRGATDRKAPVSLEIRDPGGRRADQRRRIRQR